MTDTIREAKVNNVFYAIYRIGSKEDAEKTLREIAAEANPLYSLVIFDVSEEVDAQSIPLVLRTCRLCENPSEYLGWNIWWKEDFDKKSAYCENCGHFMNAASRVDLAIQGRRVINTDWRRVK